MDDLELTRIIGQVRRAQPRNQSVMTICDELERRLVQRRPAQLHGRDAELAVAEVKKELTRLGAFDRKTYMRDYMRKRRKAQR